MSEPGLKTGFIFFNLKHPIMFIVDNIKRKSSPRNIEYHQDLISDDIPGMILTNDSFTVYKLKIQKRNINTEIGELNFMIRDNSNNLKYILVYCYMNEPEEIFGIDFYINDVLTLPNNSVVKIDPQLDEQMAEFYVKDFFVNHLEKKYKIV